ncbi:MAG: hypothetical protein H7Y42_14105 [Chitinophagaceae bacterium]|nr:hypothetical protein [Chitinophagaceae bacterium]
MSTQSFAQIRWHQERLGLMLVNHQRDKFFLHADKLLELHQRPDEYLTVKFRDRKPGRAIGYHGGEIWGNLSADSDQFTLTLYLWPLSQNAGFDPVHGVPVGFIATQKYTLPVDELHTYISAITSMLAQKQGFEELYRAAEATPISTNTFRRTL